jgi:hypothetical protein
MSRVVGIRRRRRYRYRYRDIDTGFRLYITQYDHSPHSREYKTGVVGIRSAYLCQGRKQPNTISLLQTKVLAYFRAPGLGVEPVYCSQEAPISIPTLKRPFLALGTFIHGVPANFWEATALTQTSPWPELVVDLLRRRTISS